MVNIFWEGKIRKLWFCDNEENKSEWSAKAESSLINFVLHCQKQELWLQHWYLIGSLGIVSFIQIINFQYELSSCVRLIVSSWMTGRHREHKDTSLLHEFLFCVEQDDPFQLPYVHIACKDTSTFQELCRSRLPFEVAICSHCPQGYFAPS